MTGYRETLARGTEAAGSSPVVSAIFFLAEVALGAIPHVLMS